MNPAKPVRTRIRSPREGKIATPKDRDFTVARDGVASRSAKPRADLPLAQAAYVMSVHDPRELPGPAAPEIAFAGRSNAGKSSAINTLAGRRRLAFVSKTPGRTH